jgi:hypothetical protein
MGDWIPIAQGLPDVGTDPDGGVSSVLALYRRNRLADYMCRAQVCNTVYLRAHPDEFTHWMPLPVFPLSASPTATPKQE